MTVEEQVSLAIRVVDGVSATAKQMQASAEEAKLSVDALEMSTESVNSSIDTTSGKLGTVVRESASSVGSVSADAQAMEDAVTSSMKTARDQIDATSRAMDTARMEMQTKQALELSTLMGMKEAVGSVTGGMIALGLVSEDTAQDLAKVNAGFQLMAGAATGLKTLQVLMTGLNAQTAINASLNTFLSVVRNHALGMAAVGAGIGAMAGVAGMYLYTNNQNSKTVNINVESDRSSSMSVDEMYRLFDFGAL